MRLFSLLSLLSLTIFTHVVNAETRAVTDLKAYNFPPPAGPVHKVIHEYKKGESVRLKYETCSSSTCQVVTPSGEDAWILEYKTTNAQDLEQAHSDYVKSGFDTWSKMDLAIWYSVKTSEHKLDSCALKLAHNLKFDQSKDWPAYCNTFKNTNQVQQRVAFLKRIIDGLTLNSEELSNLKLGKVWVGATEEMVMVSWGTPKKINTTTTKGTKREQWVYGNGNYVYLDNGVVDAIQN